MLGSNPGQLRLRHWLSDAASSHLARSRPLLARSHPLSARSHPQYVEQLLIFLVYFVGVGHEDFHAMSELDSDDSLLRSGSQVQIFANFSFSSDFLAKSPN